VARPRAHGPLLQALRHRRPGKSQRLIFLVGSYQRELEYDFAHELPGENFGQLWRSRRWKKLLELIDRLPRNSQYRQALMNDEEAAEQYLREFERDPEAVGSADDGRPPMAEFTLEAELLLDLVNEVKALRSEAISMETGKSPKMRFRKGPMTAIERVRLRLDQEQHNDLVSILAPRDEHGRRIAPVLADPVSDPDTITRDTLLT
jgi:hypothetical protein